MGPTENMPRIPEELSGKHIFVTGASGFMGKVLLEKLLRSCPEVGCVYLLMRPKRGVSVAERLRAILDVPLFEPLLSEHPEVACKLRVVPGDCCEIRLGLRAEDEDVLVRNVSYVFHVAATVRFDDPLHDAIMINTRGTREVVELSKKMTKLKVLEYVSTTYTFTNEPILEERHYAAHLDWKTMIKVAETADKYSLFAITKKLLGFQPNTYTLTKALAENIVNDARHDIPVIIFRPAVVISSVKEPFSGWLDNFNGPFGVWAGGLKGVLRYTYLDKDVALSFTPVDWAIRGMIACAVTRATSPQVVRPDPQHLAVVNMCVDFVRCTFRDQEQMLTDTRELAVYPIRYPASVLTRCYPYFWLGTVLTQLPYGLALDILLRLIGQKPRMMSMYRKIFYANDALSYFTMNEFPIATGKMYDVDKAMHPDDRQMFEITMDVNDVSLTVPQWAKEPALAVEIPLRIFF
ncbi:hypothetical protein ONE63_001664 [Megalurothrips usitatus]|uniref:Fatty acyl-CoA reductase n=1 Tax=Megalurothrips usitatus TaxID=439358 RepID=A0AAV7XCU9_9NEOP|nr:hypothetical protein ONE63_001664 [Megalurothrips usitatus]